MRYSVFCLCFGLICIFLLACQKSTDPATNSTGSLKDTTYLFNIDTIYRIDTIHSYDTIFSKDTIFRIDTVFSFDTTFSRETISRIDTIFSFDTTFSKDTVSRIDTIFSFDTTVTRDTIVRIDTIVINQNSWASIVDSIKDISYMVALRLESTGELLLVGSGFAVAPTTIITNAHVYIGLLSSYIIYKQRGYNVTPIAVRNGQSATGSYAFPLDTGGYHTEYNDSTVFTHDIGFFKTSSSMQKWINLPSISEIQKIKVGQDIGTLGYPGETSDRISHIAYATFKDGVISSLFPFNSSQTPTIYNTLAVQHNFNTTGGTSGSPIFDVFGKLIAINNSGAGTNIWDDATGSFKFIPSGSIGYGIRSDDYWNMLSSSKYYYESIGSYKIPQNYYYYPNSRICLSTGTKPVYLGTSMATARASANLLFNKTDPNIVYPSGSLGYWDWNYQVQIMKDATADNVWAIWIGAYESNIYLPSFSNFWGVTIGTSRSYILNTYGYNYTNSFSTDSSYYYYNYSTLGIGFGFDRVNDDDWNCDGIQIAQTGKLAKQYISASLNLSTAHVFPNLGVSEIPNIKKPPSKTDKLPIKILKMFR